MRKIGSFNSAGDQNGALRNIRARMGDTNLPKYRPSTIDGVNDMNTALIERGGFPQQSRMIKDKRRAFNQATKYSYQAALIRKWLPPHEEIEKPETDQILPELAREKLLPSVRALINPNKLTTDYDIKMLSVGWEHDFHCGDIFKWCQTNSYWIIYLQDLDELAYFRGDIRRCRHQIEWLDDNGNKQKTFVSVRGPVETKIDFIQKHTTSVDNPNLTLNILMPKNKYTMHYFRRYNKFYLKGADDPDDKICWRVEATDSISTPNILEITAMEYYSNEFIDDVENGLVDGLVVEPIDPNEGIETMIDIKGETFTRPKLENEFYVNSREKGYWRAIGEGPAAVTPPVKIIEYRNDIGYPCAKVTWEATYSSQFTLQFIGETDTYEKIVIVQSLF